MNGRVEFSHLENMAKEDYSDMRTKSSKERLYFQKFAEIHTYIHASKPIVKLGYLP